MIQTVREQIREIVSYLFELSQECLTSESAMLPKWIILLTSIFDGWTGNISFVSIYQQIIDWLKLTWFSFSDINWEEKYVKGNEHPKCSSIVKNYLYGKLDMSSDMTTKLYEYAKFRLLVLNLQGIVINLWKINKNKIIHWTEAAGEKADRTTEEFTEPMKQIVNLFQWIITDVDVFTKSHKFMKLQEINEVNKMLWKSLKQMDTILTEFTTQDKSNGEILAKMLPSYSSSNDHLNSYDESKLTGLDQAILILFIPKDSEEEELEDNSDDYHLLGIGGSSYYDSSKSLVTTLYLTLQSIKAKNMDSFVQPLQRIQRFILQYLKVGLSDTSSLDALCSIDPVLCHYSSSKILSACLHILWITHIEDTEQFITNNFEAFLSNFKNHSCHVRYRILKLLEEKSAIMLERETFIAQVVGLCSELLIQGNGQFKLISIDVLLKIIKNFDENSIARYKVVFIFNLRKSLTQPIQQLITLIDLPGVEDLFMEAFKNHIIPIEDFEEFWDMVMNTLDLEIQQQDQDYISLKCHKIFEIFKEVLNSDYYGQRTNKFLNQHLPVLYEKHTILLENKVSINEQLLCLWSLMIKNSQEIEPWMMHLLSKFECIYRKEKSISEITIESFKIWVHLWRYTAEKLSEDQYKSMLSTFIRIGTEQMFISNANANMHYIQGTIFLQNVFLNARITGLTEDYVARVINACIKKMDSNVHNSDFTRPIGCLLACLIWWDPEETARCMLNSDKQFMLFSLLLTYSRQMRYPMECQIGVLGLITFIERFAPPSTIPVFHWKAMENILYYLTRKIKFQNNRLKENEEYEYSDEDDEEEDYL